MHISCVFLILTHVDTCTALWDCALGHISCNDENDDGDEDSGVGWGERTGSGGGLFLFSALVFSSISIGGGEIRWSNWAFARKVETV